MMKRGAAFTRKVAEKQNAGHRVFERYRNENFDYVRGTVGPKDSDDTEQYEGPGKCEKCIKRSGRKKIDSGSSNSPRSLFNNIEPSERVRRSNSSTSVNSNSLKCIRNKMKVVVRIRAKQKREKTVTNQTVVRRLDSHRLLFDPPEETTEFFFKGAKQSVRPDLGSKRPNKNVNFVFDAVFDESHTNEEIFEISLKPLINHIVEGFNCSIFAYGATGSGKTYTMLGSHSNPGLTVLMAEELYRRIGMLSDDYDSEILVSYLEVYNETLKDLIEPTQSLSIVEDGTTGVRIVNLSLHKPSGPSALLSLLTSGNNARTQHSTDYNKESSRSHAVFQITVSMKEKFPPLHSKVKKVTAKLVMVDLAGSERGGAAGFAGMRQREGANINKSLLALANCINALADGKNHIPYRDSKLTRLLKDSLSGNCLTVMVANISPTKMCYDDTYNTLKYADRAKNIRVTCKRNLVAEDYSAQEQIVDLKQRCQNNEKRYEELKKKYEKLELQFNHSVGTAGAGDESSHESIHDIPVSLSRLVCSPDGKIRIVTPGRVISNKEALDTLVELLHQEKEGKEALVDISAKAKESGWQTCWTQWRFEICNFLGVLCPSDPNYTIMARMRNECCRKQEEQEVIDASAQQAKLRMEDMKTEIENVFNTDLSDQKLHEPFLTVTLQEFLDFVSLKEQISCIEKVNKHLITLHKVTFNELINSEIMKINCLDLIQNICNFLKRQGLASDEMKSAHRTIMAYAYGAQINLKIPVKNRQAGVKLNQKLKELKKFALNPIVNFPLQRDISIENMEDCHNASSSEYISKDAVNPDLRLSPTDCSVSSSLSSIFEQEIFARLSPNINPVPEAILNSSTSSPNGENAKSGLKRSQTAIILNPDPAFDVARKHASMSCQELCEAKVTVNDLNEKSKSEPVCKHHKGHGGISSILTKTLNRNPVQVRNDNCKGDDSRVRNSRLFPKVASNTAVNKNILVESCSVNLRQKPVVKSTLMDSLKIQSKLSPYLTPERERLISNGTKMAKASIKTNGGIKNNNTKPPSVISKRPGLKDTAGNGRVNTKSVLGSNSLNKRK